MARKKASPKKSLPKAAIKSPAKKPVKKVLKAKKATPEDAALNKRFLESLESLEKYWSKKVVTLKKQLESLQAKHEKASKGAKSGKNTPAYQQRQDEITNLKQELASAKLAVSKFTALSKKIEQFEREWLKKLSDEAKAKAAPNIEKKKTTKTDKQSEKILKNKIDQSPMPHFEPKAEVIESSDDEEMDDLEDIFMPQDDVSEFEVIEDFSVAEEDDLYDDYNN